MLEENFIRQRTNAFGNDETKWFTTKNYNIIYRKSDDEIFVFKNDYSGYEINSGRKVKVEKIDMSNIIYLDEAVEMFSSTKYNCIELLYKTMNGKSRNLQIEEIKKILENINYDSKSNLQFCKYSEELLKELTV